MNLFPEKIQLFGTQKTVSELLQQDSTGEQWEKDWLDFLKEWYNSDDFVEVKTSGSTGAPKLIRLKKEFVAASAQRTIRFFDLQVGDPILHVLPTKYIAGKLMVVRALIGGLDLHVADPASDFRQLMNQSFKFSAMVPNQVNKLLELDASGEAWDLDFLLIGGSAIPKNMEAKLQHVKTACYSSYAMTETATHIALRKVNGEKRDDFYRCLDEVSVRLSSDNCLQIHMPGLDSEFLQTNDLAELNDEKTFRIIGRKDNIIISGGIKFIPEQIEKKLEPHFSFPFIIAALPHDVLGQQLVLVAETVETSEAKSHILSVCKQYLEKYEVPRKVLFTSQIPRTPNGKVKRTISI